LEEQMSRQEMFDNIRQQHNTEFHRRYPQSRLSYPGFAARTRSPACDLGDTLGTPRRRADEFLITLTMIEMISSPLRQFFDRVYSGGSEKLSVLPADSLDVKEISFIDLF
jgi:hypothetical protein